MSKKETRPLVAQEAGRMETATVTAHNSYSNCSTIQNQTQAIFDLLPQGEANAIRTNELVRLTGSRSARDLQNKIAIERERGHIILSSCRNGGGYYLPSDGPEGQAEISHFVATLRSRALSTLKAIRAAKTALAQAEGQITLDELEGL